MIRMKLHLSFFLSVQNVCTVPKMKRVMSGGTKREAGVDFLHWKIKRFRCFFSRKMKISPPKSFVLLTLQFFFFVNRTVKTILIAAVVIRAGAYCTVCMLVTTVCVSESYLPGTRTDLLGNVKTVWYYCVNIQAVFKLMPETVLHLGTKYYYYYERSAINSSISVRRRHV